MSQYQRYRDYELSEGVTVRQLQLKLLEIFLYFKKICEENNLTYWCGGGTMLGAVRHKDLYLGMTIWMSFYQEKITNDCMRFGIK